MVFALSSTSQVVFHLHSPFAASLSCLSDPSLIPIHQHHVTFHGRTAYYSEYGLANAFDEGIRIGEAVGDKQVLFMANHGTLVVGPNCHRAFDDCYYLERACQFQMTAMAAVAGDRAKLSVLEDSFMASQATVEAFRSEDTREKYSVKHFFSWWNKYLKEQPEVFQ